MLLWTPGALALNISLGPDFPVGPGPTPRPGPVGARVNVVKQVDTFGLTGRLPDGTRIRLGQLEPDRPRTTHNAFGDGAGGTRIVATNALGAANSSHATGVAGIMIGAIVNAAPNPQFTGIASEAELVSASDGAGTAADFRAGIDFLTARDVRTINYSAFLNNAAAVVVGPLAIDQTVIDYDVIWTKSAGNTGTAAGSISVPGHAFNAIVVGATGATAAGASAEDYTRVANYSSRGPLGDGRHKPDLVAPGSQILMPAGGGDGAVQVDSGTSFAAPHVAGTAALLLERGQEAGVDTITGDFDHLVVKATLINSTSKHVRDPAQGDRVWVDSPAATNSAIPLDDAMGAGQLNGLAAVRQLQSDNSGLGLFTVLDHLPGATNRDYELNAGKPLHAGALVTATMVWDRLVELDAGQDGTAAAHYTAQNLPNLDLQLVNKTTGAVVAQSNSGGGAAFGGDNVEHIYFNVPSTGEYVLRVRDTQMDQEPTIALAVSAGTSEGLAFSVDGGAFNFRAGIGADPRGTGASPARNPAEGRMAPFFDQPYPNDVNALGLAGPGFFPTEGEIFVSGLDGTNMERLSGGLGTRSRVGPHNGPPAAMTVLNPGTRGVLGLLPDDNVVGLSWGTDGTLFADSVLLFSVDPAATGAAGTAVRFHAVDSPELVGPDPRPFPRNVPGGGPGGGNEAAGDIYKSRRFDPFGLYPSDPLAPASRGNALFADESSLGLQAPAGRGSLLGGAEDDLDALETDSVLETVDRNGDGLHDTNVFYNLDRWSPSLAGAGCGVYGPDDIFVSRNPFAMDVFADGICDMQLLPFDALDALVLSDVLNLGFLDKGVDEALFSLDTLSPSIAQLGARPGDVYYTDFLRAFNPLLDWKLGGSLFAPWTALGLLEFDNLNALDIRRAPEPATLALLALGLAALRLRGRISA
ncbi:MAG: S8 family serine peptidase [Gammaproteobacteria bacterium]|nr:S8 family serine peptidase [Gammaproteobacteria bacterium]